MQESDEAAGTQLGQWWPERTLQLLCEVVLVSMVLIIMAEVAARSIFGTALETADEIGGYLLVAFTFWSLSVCQGARTFHRLQLVQGRLSDRGRKVSMVVFDLLGLLFAGVLLWQLARLTFVTWEGGDVAQSHRLTPLWIPMLAMPVGAAALCLTLVRCLIVDFRTLFVRSVGS